MKIKPLNLALLATGVLSISAQAATIFDDFSTGSISADARFRADQVGLGWYASPDSNWDISTGTLNNSGLDTNTQNDRDTEGPVGQLVLSSSTDTIIEFSFDYVVGTGTTLFFHAIGLTENGINNSNEILANTGSSNGGIQNQADTAANYGDISLLTGNDPGNVTADAVALTGSGTYTGSFDVSTYSWSADEAAGGLSGSIIDLSDFDLLQFAFGANVTTTDGSGAYSIDNFSVTTIPEPSSALLLSLGALGLVVRRRR